MKLSTLPVFTLLLFSAAALSINGCSSPEKKAPDTEEMAKEENDEALNRDNAKKEADFLVEASMDNMLEAEMGKVAESKGISKAVKKFGAHMATQHTAMQEQLKAVAQTNSVVLPESLNQEYLDKIKDLQEKKAADFDKDYITEMVTRHEKDADKYQAEIDKGTDASVKKLSEQCLPQIQEHLSQARKIKAELK